MALTFQSSLNINQLYLITRSAVLHRFYHSFSYCSERLSAHFVARLITERHFVLCMHAWNHAHRIHSLLWHRDLSAGPAHMQLMPRSRYARISEEDWSIVKYKHFAISSTHGHLGMAL